jgi:hypothetical protein
MVAVIAAVVTGGPIEEGIRVSLSFPGRRGGSEESADAVQSALAL